MQVFPVATGAALGVNLGTGFDPHAFKAHCAERSKPNAPDEATDNPNALCPRSHSCNVASVGGSRARWTIKLSCLSGRRTSRSCCLFECSVPIRYQHRDYIIRREAPKYRKTIT